MKRLFFISALLLPIFLYAQTSAETWVARGMGYDSGNRYDSSTVCYRKALALDSLNVEAGWRLAAALYKLDSTRAAIDLCQSVIEIDRKCKDVYFVLGSIFFDQGSYKSAEEYLRRATEFGGPSYVQAWCRLGESYLHLSDTAQAERCFQSVLANDPAFQRAYFLLGEIARVRGQHSQAVEYYGQALRKFPLYPEALKSMADSYIALANLKGAIDCLSKAVRLTPDDAQSFYLLGKCQYQNSEPDKAKISLRRALDLNPDHPEAQALMSVLSDQ
ncbi:MAG: tetratricopeptide repeat protein [Bacteroidales bacterium]|nr:tetratricopeptide repeat protein [Bacteroidales bacterium]